MSYSFNLRNLDIIGDNVRPLGDLSCAVVNCLPDYGDVTRIKSNHHFRSQVEQFLSRQLSACHVIKPGHDAVSILDVKMLYVLASVGEFIELAKGFEKIIYPQMKAAGRPPIAQMTYEDIVLNNPASDLRVFTKGEVGKTEAAFYRGHQIIEEHLSSALSLLEEAVTSIDALKLPQAAQHIGAAFEMMRRFSIDLSREHFQTFKPFFDTNPMTQEKGPSGAFSAKIPHVDVLLHGSTLAMSTIQYLQDNAPYFPVDDYANLRLSIQQNRGKLTDIFADNRLAQATILGMAEQILSFRKSHKGAVAKHIGRDIVYGSAEKGNAVGFLDQRITETAGRVSAMRMDPI